MLKIDYSNMAIGRSKILFTIRYILNIARSWYYFNFRYPWIKYNGFIRVMKGTSFAKCNISLGHNVQFGPYCNISTDAHIGNFVLFAGRVCIIGRNDHSFDNAEQLIWHGERKKEETTIIEDDVWIGHNSTILAGITISKGSIIAAGSVVTKNVGSCEIWGGIPAKKLKDRFLSQKDKEMHIKYLNNLKIH